MAWITKADPPSFSFSIRITPPLILSPSQASRWCEEGIFLLASQSVDRCQSQDGAEAALQELERYLDTASLHTLADRNAICCQYEATLTAQLRVSRECTEQMKQMLS